MADTKRAEEQAPETCPECLGENFDIQHGAIRNPGKFEGESLATVHAYHILMEGKADEDYPCEVCGGAARVGNIILTFPARAGIIGNIYPSEAEAIATIDNGCDCEGPREEGIEP